MASKLREELLQATVEAPTMLTSHDLAELTRRSETTVHRWGRDGTEGFPKPIVAEGTTRDSSQEGGETSYGTATWALAHHP
jgi:hypothetical protein